MIVMLDLMRHTDPADHMKVIHSKSGRTLFDSRISGDFPPDLMLYKVDRITVEDNILTVYVFC